MIKIIVENKLANLVIAYVDTRKIDSDTFDQLVNADPTSNKKFIEWILKQYTNDKSIVNQLSDLTVAIKLYTKYNDLFMDYDYKTVSVSEFTKSVIIHVKSHLSKEETTTLSQTLSEYKIGKVLNHTLFLIPKGADTVSPILATFKAAPKDLVSYGDILFVIGAGDNYVLSFAADVYLSDKGSLLPIKQSKLELWDNILSWVYSKNYIKSDIVACVDIFGNDYRDSKLCRTIEQHNPEETYTDYYSNESNKLINLIVNSNPRALKDYSDYVAPFKRLGFNTNGIVVSVDLSDTNVGLMSSLLSDENYEGKVKSHFKRVGLSFDQHTFAQLRQVVDQKGTLYFVLLKNDNTGRGIFIDSTNNIIGFLNKSELTHLLGKFSSAKTITELLKTTSAKQEDKLKDYRKRLDDLEKDIKTIIDNGSSLKHYIII